MRKIIALACAAVLVLAGCTGQVTGADGTRYDFGCDGPTLPPATPTPGSVSCSWSPVTPSVAPTTPALTTPAAQAFPGPASTGAPTETGLDPDSRCALNTAGEVINGKRLTCATRISVNVTGVTIRNSVIESGLNNWSSSGNRTLTVEDSTIGTDSRGETCVSSYDFALGAKGLTVRRAEIYGLDGLRLSETGTSVNLIEDSYIEVCSITGAHSDGLQADGTTGGHTIRNNTFNMARATSMTAAVFWGDWAAGPATVTGNLFYGYRNFGTFMSKDGGANHIVNGNRFQAGTGGVHNRQDMCPNINWGADNRTVTVNADFVVTATGPAIPCG
jgi:hypothetical protein